MLEPRFQSVAMTPVERRVFLRRAAADRLAFESAEALAEQRLDAAANLARDAVALVGPDRIAFWLRHYAVTKFKVAAGAVAELLRRALPGTLAA
jgi:hypothetical protein